MATTSNAGAGMSFSNAQQGTRGMSASDWIRMKRLKGARENGYTNGSTNGLLSSLNTSGNPNQIFNKDVAPPQTNQDEIHNKSAINVFPVVGTSKIRRPASNWTDYVASQTADYVLSSQNSINATSVKNTVVKVCSCISTPLSTKTGICTKCNQTTHVRIM